MQDCKELLTMRSTVVSLVLVLPMFSLCDCQVRIENVALNKDCYIESNWNQYNIDPKLAVNNNTKGEYPGSPLNCIHTGTSTNTWWKVDLGRPYPVYSITVWGRTGHINRMNGCVINVDDKLCYKFTSTPNVSTNEIRINCTTGVQNGRIVRVSKSSPNDAYSDYTINICEFQVWSCTSRYWGGPLCDKECGYCSDNTICDKITGHCPCKAGYYPPLCTKACDQGTYGQNCTKTCSINCDGGDCNKSNGSCSCLPGWTSIFCDQACRSGTHGKDCGETCGKCANNETCKKETGHCPMCPPGLMPPFCKQVCNEGFYGENCSQQCGRCANISHCHPQTGNCSSGCEEGFGEALCQLALGVNESTGAIAGTVVSILVVLASLTIIILIIIRRRRLKGKTRESKRVKSSNSPHLDNIYENSTCVDHIDKPVLAVKPRTHDDNYKNTSSNKEDKLTSLPPQIYNNISWTSKDADLSGDVPDAVDAKRLGNLSVNQPSDLYMNSQKSSVTWTGDNVQQHLINKLKNGNFEEFEGLHFGLKKSHTVGLKKENYNKNRFMSILPYDETRVVLKEPFDEESNDYINASYITGLKSAKDYIAAQGPKKKTIKDFWKMVVQEHVTHIVMLTNMVEGEKIKCEEYWPATGTEKEYGDVYVTGSGHQERADFVIRMFDIRDNSNEARRSVIQFHYTVWQDHSIPAPMSLIDFWRSVRISHQRQPKPSPLLVHCSAGVGRTGTYIALDIALDHIGQRRNPDILNIVSHIRLDRCNMIQAKSQYIFLHEAVLEAYTSRHTRLDATEFKNVFPNDIDRFKLNERIDGEFQVLQHMKELFHKVECHEAELEENVNKNRFKEILPDDKHLVYLTDNIPGRNQYINAVFMSTFSQRMGRILAQLPLPETVLDHWRLIHGNDVTIIVCLDPETCIESLNCYWPREDVESMTIGEYSMSLKSQQDIAEGIRIYSLSFKHELGTSRDITVLHYFRWTEEIPADISQLGTLIDTLTSLNTEGHRNPVLVQCQDGASKCGLFSAACDIISRITNDREVDVYMAVRHVHEVRPQSVSSLVQYRYLYQVAQEYTQQLDVYANA